LNELTVVMIEPDQKPYIAKVKKDIKTFEEIVKGPVDVANFRWSGYRIVCNVEAWYGYRNSATLPEATSFILKYYDDFVGLSTEEAKEIISKLKRKKQRKKSGVLSFLFNN
jgi:hypothetical protein